MGVIIPTTGGETNLGKPIYKAIYLDSDLLVQWLEKNEFQVFSPKMVGIFMVHAFSMGSNP